MEQHQRPRRILAAKLDEGWDSDVDPFDHQMIQEILKTCLELSRFKQPLTATVGYQTPNVATLGSSFLRPLAEGFGGLGGGGEAEALKDQQPEYIIKCLAEAEHYVIHILFARDWLPTASQLGHILSLYPAHIMPNLMTWGIDFERDRPFLVIGVRFIKAQPIGYDARMLIMQQYGTSPAFRTSVGSALMGDGVSVKRTADGIFISNHNSPRKKPKVDKGSF